MSIIVKTHILNFSGAGCDVTRRYFTKLKAIKNGKNDENDHERKRNYWDMSLSTTQVDAISVGPTLSDP